MALKGYKSRLHLLVAKKAPTVVILQRKRAKLFHVVLVDAKKRRIEHGSWFRGKLYMLRCDVSFDGRYMVYMAMGSNGNTWNGVCRLPWLTTLTEADNMGSWFGGGYFADKKLLRTNGWGRADFNPPKHARAPFTLEPYGSRYGGEDLGVVYERLARDGFRRLGENWGTQHNLGTRKLQVACEGDDGWGWRFSGRYPMLKARYIGYLEHGYTLAFWFDEYPNLLTGASWANWDCNGNLWVARPGVVEQYTLSDLNQGAPSFAIDVEQFEPPPRNMEAA
ncbi:MAG TPA: hypothetical protein VFU22_26160 [Roseiflexaceae bacterium]|nr:hypothetical protein [Roseiflexaceae bacterium]